MIALTKKMKTHHWIGSCASPQKKKGLAPVQAYFMLRSKEHRTTRACLKLSQKRVQYSHAHLFD
jgi:hypothetical protein